MHMYMYVYTLSTPEVASFLVKTLFEHETHSIYIHSHMYMY